MNGTERLAQSCVVPSCRACRYALRRICDHSFIFIWSKCQELDCASELEEEGEPKKILFWVVKDSGEYN